MTDSLRSFKERYFIISTSELFYNQRDKKSVIKNNFDNDLLNICKNISNNSYHSYLLIDFKTQKLIACFEGDINKSVTLSKDNNIEYLDNYKTNNIDLVYNQNLLNNRYLYNIESIYAFNNNVWIMIEYLTQKSSRRFIINKQIFGDLKYFNSRQFKIDKLTESI